MDKERIRNEAEAFFEWPTHDKTHVTTTSMLIFAGVIADMAAAEAVQSEQAWRKDAEAVLKKMAGEGWITHAGMKSIVDAARLLCYECERIEYAATAT